MIFFFLIETVEFCLKSSNILISLKISFLQIREKQHVLAFCAFYTSKTCDHPFLLLPGFVCDVSETIMYYQTITKDIISIFVAIAFPQPYFY